MQLTMANEWREEGETLKPEDSKEEIISNFISNNNNQ